MCRHNHSPEKIEATTILTQGGITVQLRQNKHRLTALKKVPEFAWLNDVSCVPIQQSLRHQQAAFSNFFAGRAAYPAFKSKCHKQAAELTASAFKYRDGSLYMAKSKTPLDVRWPRPLPFTLSTVGIDVSLKYLFVTDTGFKSGNPRHTAKYAARLTLKQKSQRLKEPRQSPLKGDPTPRENCRLPNGCLTQGHPQTD